MKDYEKRTALNELYRELMRLPPDIREKRVQEASEDEVRANLSVDAPLHLTTLFASRFREVLGNEGSFVERGRLLVCMEESDAAKELFDEALRLGDEDVHYELGVWFEMAGLHEDAVRHYTIAAPYDSDAAIKLGVYLLGGDDPEMTKRAEELFKQAVENQNLKGYGWLANIEVERENWDKVKQYAHQVIEAGNPAGYAYLGKAAEKKGNFDEALKWYTESAVKCLPEADKVVMDFLRRHGEKFSRDEYLRCITPIMFSNLRTEDFKFNDALWEPWSQLIASASSDGIIELAKKAIEYEHCAVFFLCCGIMWSNTDRDKMHDMMVILVEREDKRKFVKKIAEIDEIMMGYLVHTLRSSEEELKMDITYLSGTAKGRAYRHLGDWYYFRSRYEEALANFERADEHGVDCNMAASNCLRRLGRGNRKEVMKKSEDPAVKELAALLGKTPIPKPKTSEKRQAAKRKRKELRKQRRKKRRK